MEIELNGLTKIYGKEDAEVRALDQVNLKITDGEFVSVMGPSGCGKTTLLNILGLMDVPTGGEYRLDGVDVATFSEEQKADIRSRRLSFVFQSFALMEGYTVFDNVALPLFRCKYSRVEKEDRIRAALRELGMEDLIRKDVKLLSGGQKQRVAIARSLVADANLLLADEPTGALDSDNSKNLMELIQSLHQKGKTILLITHDEKVAEVAERRIHMLDGKIVSDNNYKEVGL